MGFMLMLIYQTGYGQSGGLFYYGMYGKVQLTPVTDEYTLEFSSPPDTASLAAVGIYTRRLAPMVYTTDASFAAVVSAAPGNYDFQPVYSLDDGLKLNMLNQVVLRWKPETNEAVKVAVRAQYGLQLIRQTRLYELYRAASPLSTSRMIFESGHVLYCTPEFIAPVEKFGHIPNDEYFGKQFYLHNTGQLVNDGLYGTPGADIDAPEAWDITTGNNGIVVAVIDEGVTSNHPDLPNSRQMRLAGSNIAAPYDGSDPDDPSPTGDENHGNACAGIVAAEMDNNEGVVGVCPNCTVMPVKVRFGQGLTWADFADAITFAVDNSAHVISCSWGSNSPNPNLNSSVLTAIQDAIDHGAVVMFATGNNANHVNNGPGYVGFPANANIPLLLSVGASDRNDLQANYSPTDPKVDIVAPSHTAYACQIPTEGFNVWSIDIPGQAGYNPWPTQTSSCMLPPGGMQNEVLPSSGVNYLSYTGRMGGTSAATPEIAGIAGLMLSVNPCLSVGQVRDILLNTAEKVGGYDYHWSASVPGHSKEMGHGRANAFKAVEAAHGMYTAGRDLFSKDGNSDFGIEPNTATEYLWTSEDIWVRNQPDGFQNHENENPEYGQNVPVYVYVMVRNKGCLPSGGEAVKLYWAKAATALTWPQYWDGTITTPALMGAPIGVKQAPSMQPGETGILEFEWYPPNPADYENINSEPWHFCLLSRIDDPADPMNDEQWTGTWNLGHNVAFNNNIVWKNISIVDIIPGMVGGNWPDDKLVGATVAIGNATGQRGAFTIELTNPKEYSGNAITDEAEVRVTLDPLGWDKWVQGGQRGANIAISRALRHQLIVTGSPARIENLEYGPHERSLLDLSFNFLTRKLSGKPEFEYHVIQRDGVSDQALGGEKYVIRMPVRAPFIADAGNDKEAVVAEQVLLSAAEINEDAIYNWYSPEGELLQTGKNLVVDADVTKKYKLEVIAQADGLKDYDEVRVKVRSAAIRTVVPNPASNNAVIGYDAQNCSAAYLVVTMPYTGVTNNYILNVNADETTIDVSNFPIGVYGVFLVADGVLVDEIGLVVTH